MMPVWTSRQKARTHLRGGETFPQVGPYQEKNQLVKVYKFNRLESTLNYI